MKYLKIEVTLTYGPNDDVILDTSPEPLLWNENPIPFNAILTDNELIPEISYFQDYKYNPHLTVSESNWAEMMENGEPNFRDFYPSVRQGLEGIASGYIEAYFLNEYYGRVLTDSETTYKSQYIPSSVYLHADNDWLPGQNVLFAELSAEEVSSAHPGGQLLGPELSFSYTSNAGTFYEEEITSVYVDYFWWKLDPTISFTKKSDTVDYNTVATEGYVWEGNPYKALAGKDFVILPTEVNASKILNESDARVFKYNKNFSFNGGKGDDEIDGSNVKSKPLKLFGGSGDDTITGGDGDDVLDGGEGIDTIVFKVKPKDSKFHFKKAKSEAENRDNDLSARVVVPVKGTEKDTILKGEIGDFNGEKHSISKITVEISRNPDGTAGGTVIDNGLNVAELTSALQNGKGGGMWYDTLTPIAAGTYAGYYRVGGNGKCIELEDWSTGSSGSLVQTVDGINIERTVVQLHPGLRNGSSEGCFLTGKRADFQNKLFAYLQEKVPGDEMKLNSRNDTYFPVIPVTVEVSGNVPQPKVVGTSKAVGEAADKNFKTKVAFDVTNDNGGISQKAIDVFFKASGTATFGEDWAFAEKFTTRDWKDQEHGDIWVQKGVKGGADAIYGIRIGRDGDDMYSRVNFDVKILADSKSEANETVKFKIVDLDLYTRTQTRGWDKYDVSKDGDSDASPNGAERLLLSKGQMVSKLTIKDSTPSPVSEPESIVSFDGYDWFI